MSNAANTVTLNGQPFEMLPLNWKQLKDMREEIILIDGTERLDDESRAALYEKCRAKGLQFIATRTTNDDEMKVVEL